VLRATAAAEEAGVPAVSLVATGFLKLAGHVAKGLGLGASAIAEYPGVPMTDDLVDVKRKAREVVAPQVIAGLTQAGGAAEVEAEAATREAVFTGSLQAVQQFYYDQGWTDGLPVMPPTMEAVADMLRYTDRAPDEVIAVLLPENREATVWNTAVNGVMAGCRPEYMPILLAIVEAVADREFRIEDAGATPGWEPLVVVNGPMVRQLSFNHGTGAMRAGYQANTTIGRFLKLCMRNIAGIRIPPGDGDKGSIGANFNVALAEDEDSAAALGWSNFATDRGFARDDNVVTVQSVVYTTPPIYSGGSTALEHLQLIADIFGQTASYRTFIGIKNHKYCPLLVLGPSIAEAIARGGYSKDDIRNYLYDTCKVSAGAVERYAWHGGHTTYDLKELVQSGEIAPEYHESDDPGRLIRVFTRPEQIGIVVAGDAGRNQSKGYFNNHIQGAPVSRRVVFPATGGRK
jgi:hypothetical protein